ncbi:ADP-ribosylation factor family [Popillia japonica]|uniref:ADP-ribosylation factor family n=1 Tax=Popillia japonica TaxID=7064 RepID=A0AAW1IEL7_POPJA
MCLCLGPTGSGKTLLLRKIQHINAVDETTTAVPTVGTNLFNLRRGNIQIEIRELGGIMAPIWPKYFASANRIMYVVDASNLCQISAAGVLLYTVLAHPQVKNGTFSSNKNGCELQTNEKRSFINATNTATSEGGQTRNNCNRGQCDYWKRQK